jgi:predicted GNAT family acetyltransferase
VTLTINLEAEAATREENNVALIAALDKVGLSEVKSSWELDVINDPEHGRWVATLGADAIAELTYRFVGGRVVLLSTWVNHAYRNHRVATELVARVLDEIRESGKKITIICPVVGEFIARNPQYLDLIDKGPSGLRRLPRARTRGRAGRRAADRRVRARHDLAVHRSDVVRDGINILGGYISAVVRVRPRLVPSHRSYYFLAPASCQRHRQRRVTSAARGRAEQQAGGPAARGAQEPTQLESGKRRARGGLSSPYHSHHDVGSRMKKVRERSWSTTDGADWPNAREATKHLEHYYFPRRIGSDRV